MRNIGPRESVWRKKIRITGEGNAAARKLAEEIIALNPNYPKEEWQPHTSHFLKNVE